MRAAVLARTEVIRGVDRHDRVPGGAQLELFTLPNKPGAERIAIRSSAPDSRIPPPGTRAAPTHAGAMPKLESDPAPVITAEPGAPCPLIGSRSAPGPARPSSAS